MVSIKYNLDFFFCVWLKEKQPDMINLNDEGIFNFEKEKNRLQTSCDWNEKFFNTEIDFQNIHENIFKCRV